MSVLGTFACQGPIKCGFSLLFAVFLAGSLYAATSPAPDKAPACQAGLEFDAEADLHALDVYKSAIQQVFTAQDFTALDCLADRARKNKEKFKGGAWKLHNIYSAISQPKGHGTEEDWAAHFQRIQQWITANPGSITARIVLAESYIAYAWNARGGGYSDTVTDSGWKLFGQRLDQAENTLRDANALKTKCPEWYVAMQQVALGKGWDIPKASALLHDAVSFEPTYYYYYRLYATYLLPNWHGEEGDAERFMAEAANRIGGEQGDIIYFEVATFLLCHCRTDNFKMVSWPRIQKGFAALETESGVSLEILNEVAYIAMKENDAITAQRIFKRIGDNWSESVWGTQAYFDTWKNWGESMAPIAAHNKAVHDEAEANLQTEEGREFTVQVQAKVGAVVQKCSAASKDDSPFTDLVIQASAGSGYGYLNNFIDVPSAEFMNCFWGSFNRSRITLPIPPRDPYYVKIPFHPSSPS